MEKPSESFANMQFFSEEAQNATLPNQTEYDFLYERNKNYMNNNALTFDKKKVSYEELHTRIDEYARALYKRGVREGDIIALAVANTPEAVYLYYALNKLGAIVCPINPIDNAYKMLEDLKVVKPKMFIGIQDSYGNFKKASKGMNIDVITFPAVQSMDNRLVKSLYFGKQFINGNILFKADHVLSKVLENGKNAEDVIFPGYKPGTVSDLMFTGGSSGTHKAVMLDGNGLNCVTKSLDYVTELQPGEIFMGNLPQFMAFGKLSLHYALCKNTDVHLTLKALPEFFKEELYRIHPAGVFAGPVQWERFINEVLGEMDPNFGKVNFSLNSSEYKEYLIKIKEMIEKNKKDSLSLEWLKMGVSGGEQLKNMTEMVCNMIFSELGAPDSLWNGLGMTEMWAPVAVKMGKKNTDGTIGPMIPFNNLMVVDPNTFEELDYNQIGLLCVNGPGMMLGYYENDEETEKVFIEKNGQKWLVTGDIVKLSSNGELKFVDRLKRCFVCGVENIYPQRIENLLSNVPEIAETIVTKIPDNDLQYVPKYHISLKSECDIEQLKKKIEKLITSTLGQNYLPHFYDFTYEKLPRTANGKLDSTKLQKADNEENMKLVLKK